MSASSRRFLASLVAATGLLACSGGHPTAPTSTSLVPASAGTLSVATAPVIATTISWPCLLTGGSALPAVGCSASLEKHAVRFAAASGGAPSAPTNLIAVISGSTVTLTWLAPPGTQPATDYLVQAGSAAGLSNLANSDLGSAALSVTVTNVPSGTYFVRVLAANNGGLSGPSNEIVVTVAGGAGPCGSVPSAPTGLTERVSGSTVTLAWVGSAGTTSYLIQAGSAVGLSDLDNSNTGSAATSVTVSAPNGTYYVRVAAVNACGTSAASNEVVVAVGAQTINFADTFDPPSALWNNLTGSWTASNGQYFARFPNNAPGSDTLLPYVMGDYTLNVTMNAIGDEGVLARNNAFGSIYIILGGEGYGQGARGGQAGTTLYFGVDGVGLLTNPVYNAVVPGATYAVKVTAVGNVYSIYLNGSSTPVDTFTDSANNFTSGRVGLYDDQPNTTTGSGFGAPTTFSNFSLQGTVVVGTPAALTIMNSRNSRLH